ncbi:hypothetical protein AL522_16015 [Pantoea vagans]|nr:hypothetical protein AL522_16015 [Pantoea vagans]
MRVTAGGSGWTIRKNEKIGNTKKQKSRSDFPERDFLILAPLTGITFAINWIINQLNLNLLSVKTSNQY